MRPLPNVSDVDARSFVYPLASLASRLEWQLEEHASALARVRQRLSEAQADQLEQQNSYNEAVCQILDTRSRSVDPDLARFQLQHLLSLKAALATARQHVEEIEQQCAQCQQQYVTTQVKLEGYSVHREELFTEYVSLQRQRYLAESDRDWLARKEAERFDSLNSRTDIA